MSYEDTNPGDYDKRFQSIPREGYLYGHWKPLVEAAIRRYGSGKKIALDLGCGTGTYFMPSLEDTADYVVGIDLSINFLKYGKKFNEGFELVMADAHKLPLKSESIDIVTTNLFEYVNRTTTLNEIYRILKKDGICMILTINRYSAYTLLFRPVMKYPQILRLFGKEHHKNEASKKELFILFKDTKFKIIEYNMDDGLIWLPNIVDKLVGDQTYKLVEHLCKFFGENPLSDIMLFIIKKS